MRNICHTIDSSKWVKNCQVGNPNLQTQYSGLRAKTVWALQRWQIQSPHRDANMPAASLALHVLLTNLWRRTATKSRGKCKLLSELPWQQLLFQVVTVLSPIYKNSCLWYTMLSGRIFKSEKMTAGHLFPSKKNSKIQSNFIFPRKKKKDTNLLQPGYQMLPPM